MWVEFRCSKCGKSTVQSLIITNGDVFCPPNSKHRGWPRMKRSPGASIADAREAQQREIAKMREEMVA